MQSLQFDFSLARYAFVKALGGYYPSLTWHSKLSCLRYRDIPEPQLLGDDWVKINVTYSGICGSDINLLSLHDSPSTSPYASFPFTIGHEIVGKITVVGNNVQGLKVGDRVVVDPVLSCQSRGITPMCSYCQEGDYSLCNHKTDGQLSPGLLIGACKETGGGWSSHFVAHQSQVFVLPDEVDDLNGVMVEPFSCSLHAIMRNPPKPDDTVLIIGAGVIGLCTIAALRALGYTCKIKVLAKHPFQIKLAKQYGADEVIKLQSGHSYYSELAQSLDASLLKAIIGPPVVQGGADIIYECVGTEKSIHDALRFTRNGGKIVILGLASIMNKIDWTTIWLNELDIQGSFAYSTEEYQGKKWRTLGITIQLMKEGKVDLSPMVTHQYPLSRYKEALQTATSKGRGDVMKILFQP